jgi:cytoskeletal protein RodZ
MKHLDEGTLQAWLDMPRSGLEASEVAEIEGHLATCEACAIELETLRGSDASVHALLSGGLDRDIARPPFEEVVARAESRTDGGGTDARRGLSRLNRLAWAASVVVALGVGWMTNEIYRAGPPDPSARVPVAAAPDAQIAAEAPSSTPAAEDRAQESNEEARTAEPAPARSGRTVSERATQAPADLGDADAVASRAEDLVGGGAGVGAPAAPEPDAPPALRYERQRASADDATGDAVAAAPTGAAAPPANEPVLSRGVRADQDSSIDGRPVVRGFVTDSASGEPVASAQVFVQSLNVGALSDEDGSYVLVLPPGDSMDVDVTVERIGYRPETKEVEVAASAPSVVDFSLHEEALLLQEVVVTGDAGGVQRRALGNAIGPVSAAKVYDWRPDTRESAEDKLGRPLLTVPGFEILAIESVEPDEQGVDALVRVRQAVGADGTELILVEGRSDESREAWEIQSEGSIASTRRDGMLVTGTSALSQEYLRTLLDSLR